MFHGEGWVERRMGPPQSLHVPPHCAYPQMYFLQGEGIDFLLVFEAGLDCKEQGRDRLYQVLRNYLWVSSRGSNIAQYTVNCVDLGNRHNWIFIWALIFPNNGTLGTLLYLSELQFP